MCTASWLFDESGYSLLFNRDEKKTRLPGLPPEVHRSDGTRYISPLDGDHRGTWVAVNEFGVSIALLNGPYGGGRQSRGLLIPRLISARTSAEALGRFRAITPRDYAPFRLLLLEPRKEPKGVVWNGQTLALDSPSAPLISSSFDPEGAGQFRHRLFAELCAAKARHNSEDLLAFHASHGGPASAYSPCMHRDDAETVSFTSIRVDSQIQLQYSAAAPCQHAPLETKTLAWAS